MLKPIMKYTNIKKYMTLKKKTLRNKLKMKKAITYCLIGTSLVLFPNTLKAQSGTTDAAMNWTQIQSYDENGNIISATKSFFDQRGLSLQNQVFNLTENNVLVSQPLYDAFGRSVLNTLPAPIQHSGFSYKEDFVQTADGVIYDFTHFDEGAKRTSPDTIGNNEPGTLGWYYSNNNHVEPYVAASAFPYSRVEYYEDGSGQVKRSAGAGYAHSLGAGHETYTHNFPIQQELDGNYLTIRNAHVFPGSPLASWANCGVSTVNIDPNGRSVIAFSDADGNVLASAVPGSDAPSESVDVNLEVPMPELYYANLSGAVTSIADADTIRLRIIGNHVIQVFDQHLSVSDKLLFEGLVSDRELAFAFTSSGNNFNLQIRSLSPFNYEVLQANGQWQALGAVQTTNEKNSGTEFYLPPGQHSVSLINDFPTINSINVRFEKINVDSVFNVAVTGSTAKMLSGGFYRVTYLEDSDDLNSFPLYTNYQGNVVIGYSYWLGEWSYNYYDDSDRLVASISPNGVQQLQEGVSYTDIDKTTYEYNYQGWLLAQESKDAGRSEFMYRKDGAIRFSQNAKQRETGVFSYTNYNISGLPIESGEFDPAGTSLTFGSASLKGILENRTASGGLPYGFARSDWTRTAYDVPDHNFDAESELSGYSQDFVMGAVSFTENEDVKTWYSYDDQGRVTWVGQHIKELNRTFTMDYRYDFIGNVLEMVFQQSNPAERFYHHYTYDADQRLSQVFTSLDGSNRTLQANYEYYLHGPLKRVELGGNLQGIDYVYTIQGALKSINHPNKASDPGGDGSDAFHPDILGIAMDYFEGDYERSGSNIRSISPANSTDRYAGNLKAVSWHLPMPDATGNTDPLAYAFNYDHDYQLKSAAWGNPDFGAGSFIPVNAFSLNGLTYDPNGNLKTLQRGDDGGDLLHDFDYQYYPNSNQLSNIPNHASYTYDAIGQLSQESPVNGPEKHLTYDVTGKVTGVYTDAEHTQPVVQFMYDDKGFRIKKASYLEGALNQTTWYIRDAVGQLVAIYHDLNEAGSPSELSLKELPIYGQSKLGMYYAQRDQYYYELTDHLGTVRAVISNDQQQYNYTATMEDAVIEEERRDFNFPEGTVQALGQSKVAKLNSVNRVGPNMTIQVMPGDEIDIAADAAYFDVSGGGNTNIGPAILSTALTAFAGSPISTEDWLYRSIAESPAAASFFAFDSDDNESFPRGYLNYMFFDMNFNFVDAGYSRNPDTGSLSADNLNFTSVVLEITEIDRPGYVFIYTTNESATNDDIYFDNLNVTHEPGIIKSMTDYYPFGLEIASRQFSAMGLNGYRYAYQGEFAEKDEETGWNAFELRMYDPVIGRWLSTDPAEQYASPYLAMGNNPMSRVDPDGGVDMRALPWQFISLRNPIKSAEFYVSAQLKHEIKAPQVLFDQLDLPYAKGAKAVTTIVGVQQAANWTSLSWNEGTFSFEATSSTDWPNPTNSTYIDFESSALNPINIRFYAPTPIRGDFISGTRVLVTLGQIKSPIGNAKVQGDFVNQQDYWGLGGRFVGETLSIRWGDGELKGEVNAGFRLDLQWPLIFDPINSGNE